MAGRAIMVQGTSSNVGKSVLCAALCRIFRQDGYRVAPFKSQNMALNSYVTADGGEIGRAQGIQAEAAGLEATVDMNPILLKPTGDRRAQVVVRGRPVSHMTARDYRQDYVSRALGIAAESLQRLLSTFDIVVMEGAGSPAEINLREGDIANMEMARLAQAPVILVGDVDRGGVFASIVGTLELISPAEREMVAGFVINKFRGDESLLRPGLEFLEQRTGKPVFGVIPYFTEPRIDEEDSVGLEERRWRASPATADADPAGTRRGAAGEEDVTIAVLHLPRISNFSDFDPLAREPGTRVRYVRDGEPLLPCDAAIIPGSKSTMADLAYLRRYGYDRQLTDLAAAGRPVIGICGGYQMLGKSIIDEGKVEGDQAAVPGLGLLPVTTVFRARKTTARVEAEVVAESGFLAGMGGTRVSGYEIHMGRTRWLEGARHLFRVLSRDGLGVEEGEGAGEADGAVNEAGTVFGTYIHGLFDRTAFRRRFLNRLRMRRGLAPLPEEAPGEDQAAYRYRSYELLADIVRRHMDMAAVYRLLGIGEPGLPFP